MEILVRLVAWKLLNSSENIRVRADRREKLGILAVFTTKFNVFKGKNS